MPNHIAEGWREMCVMRQTPNSQTLARNRHHSKSALRTPWEREREETNFSTGSIVFFKLDGGGAVFAVLEKNRESGQKIERVVHSECPGILGVSSSGTSVGGELVVVVVLLVFGRTKDASATAAAPSIPHHHWKSGAHGYYYYYYYY